MNATAANFDSRALCEEEKQKRFAAIEGESIEVFRHFALEDGFGAPSVTNVATAIAPRHA